MKVRLKLVAMIVVASFEYRVGGGGGRAEQLQDVFLRNKCSRAENETPVVVFCNTVRCGFL
jgi:hypothetical protein